MMEEWKETECSLERKHIACTSCLSAYVKKLLCEACITNQFFDAFTSYYTLEQNHMKMVLPTLNDGDFTEVWFQDAVHKISPVLNHVHFVYSQIPFCDIDMWIEWTHYKKVFLECFKLLRDSESSCSVPLALLILTAYLERALGNVLLLKQNQVPAMLKDLLATEELKNIFGHESILFLQILMGPPISLNLRNILWHGFVAPSEVSSRHGYILLAIVRSFGEKLEKLGLKPEHIPCRSWLSFQQTETWINCFPEITDSCMRIAEEIFRKTTALLPQMLPYWKEVLSCFRNQKYGQCLVILLPQIENCLRNIFVAANDCPERIVTAEATMLYTTFDEIFSEFVHEKTNKIRNVLGDTYIELLLDLLVYPEGPRVRDRLSHGEVLLEDIPHHLVNHVLNISVAICCKFVCPSTGILQEIYVKDVITAASTYKPHFHPLSILKRKLLQAINKVMKWKDCPITDLNDPPDSGETTDKSIDVTHLIQAICKLYNVDNDLKKNLVHCDFQMLSNMLKKLHPETLYRPKYEGEITTLLRQIVSHIIIVADQVSDGLQTRYYQWCKKEMRSRQRLTYSRLLCRLLKSILKYTENLEIMTNATKNRWEECCCLSKELLEFISYFSQKQSFYK
ncbi:endoplasmic reticulum membrane-associated RNA degradation protein-like isoform X2 [Limulus polyphemus]|uniref:Endoplasmic reticulum membrane-associated RNA degradation protein-like isoform X2 n=1 Tax=Limulus polyphemus TaxID=6850 RepID=A0ABM1T3G3_LIMPO|nr:endoplasmic reticulum membrane-associated RNA degradation protein-like isoform X2 [Limulus polyphemus]